MSRPKGVNKTLYSVWRNSDDCLLILDGTAEQCAEAMDVSLKSFFKYVSWPDYQAKFTIRKTEQKRKKGAGK